MTVHKPEFVTFTGLDERTDLNRVETLSADYGIERVEWGVLISRSNTGHRQRYPAQPIIEGLATLEGFLSVHICGDFARQIAVQNVVDLRLAELIGELSSDRDQLRGQINIGDGELMLDPMSIYGDAPGSVCRFGSIVGLDPILQCRLKFPDDKRVAWLYDVSGGAGLATAEWPRNARDLHEDVFVGYAGGIGPENIEQKLEEISAAHGSKRRFWIDMESRVRTDDWLDLDKCEAVLKAVYG